MVNCLVVVAGLVGDAMRVGVGNHVAVVPAVTGAPVGAVQDVLDGKVSRWPSSTSRDVDAVYARQMFHQKK